MSGTLPQDEPESRWRQLEALFHAASGLSGEEREIFIERETGGDIELGDELRALLRSSERAEERIATAVKRVVDRVAGATYWVGRRFGPYRLVREIGRGGMGLVFEAYRDDSEYAKRVALKVAPDWRDLDRLRERFRTERQILARLEHPNIARFFDGGTEDGIPYFAMEYIDGKPVTIWAAEHNLRVRERVALFRQICGAVSYAHENLVVHRDLKPGNILVDANRTPKLLDFGIAAALLDDMEEKTAATTGLRLWTPDYASPEQVRGGVVTVRADVYSLGLILYELLCGQRAQTADASSPAALDRSICETDPAPPSARAAAGGDRDLSRQLRGDLDRIVAKAIRKEPERRYSSAAALDADLGRYLDGRPVTARPNTIRYRISKLVRRRRLASMATVLMVLTLAGGIWSTLYQARRAERRFQQVRALANAFVFDVHDRIRELPGATEARKAIVTTALRYLENLRQDSGNDRALLRELAAAYAKIGDVQGNPYASSLGDSHGALQSYRNAESILKQLAGKRDKAANLELLSTVYKLASLEHAMGSPEGLPEFQRARIMARQLIADQPTNFEGLGLASNINADLARIAADARSPEESLSAAREATRLAERLFQLNPGNPESLGYLGVAQNALATAYRYSGDLNLAAQTFHDALATYERLVKEHPDNTTYRRMLLLTYGALGDILGLPESDGLGRLPEALAAYERAAEIALWMSQRDPADRVARFDLAVAHMRSATCLLGQPDGSAKALAHLALEESILADLGKEDPSNQRYGIYLLSLDGQKGKALQAARRDAEAQQRLQHARLFARSFGGGPSELNAQSLALSATLRLSEIKARGSDRISGLAMADESAAGYAKGELLGNDWSHALFCRRLGSVYRQIGHRDSARLWLQKSADLWRKMKIPTALYAQRDKALAEVEHELERL